MNYLDMNYISNDQLHEMLFKFPDDTVTADKAQLTLPVVPVLQHHYGNFCWIFFFILYFTYFVQKLFVVM